MTGRLDDAHDVFEDVVVDVDALSDAAQREDVIAGEHGGDGLRAVADVDLPQEVDAYLMAGVPDRRLDEETVHLGFGQLVCAELFDRVLRGDHDERLRHVVRDAVHGDFLFLHDLQQCGLGLRRGSVDLVGEHDGREYRALAELELAVLLVVEGDADHVGRQQVGRELDALERRADRARDASCQLSLAGAWVVFEQDMATDEQGGQA